VPYDDLFRTARTPMDVCGIEDCISIHLHLKNLFMAQQDAVIVEQRCGACD